MTIVIFIIVLVILILSHEIGHAVAAILTGCRVEEFGIGFPPRIYGKKIRETLFSLNIIPLGGFVKITGEDEGLSGDLSKNEDPRSFANKNFIAKIFILVAGVAMNIFLAILLYSIISFVGSSVPVDGLPADMPIKDKRVEIVGVEKNDVLQKTNIREGDVLAKVDGKDVFDSNSAVNMIREFSGQELELTLTKDNISRVEKIIFEGKHELGKPVGLALLDVATYRVRWYQAPVEGVKSTWRVTKMTASGIAGLFYDLIWHREVPKDVAGPVGIAKIVGQVSGQGAMPLLELMAVLSINLAIINILPIPALDGGRVLFVIVDALGIKAFKGRREQVAHSIGFFLLIALVLLITINDVRKLFSP